MIINSEFHSLNFIKGLLYARPYALSMGVKMQTLRCTRRAQLSKECAQVDKGERYRFSRKLSKGLGQKSRWGLLPWSSKQSFLP